MRVSVILTALMLSAVAGMWWSMESAFSALHTPRELRQAMDHYLIESERVRCVFQNSPVGRELEDMVQLARCAERDALQAGPDEAGEADRGATLAAINRRNKAIEDAVNADAGVIAARRVLSAARKKYGVVER